MIEERFEVPPRVESEIADLGFGLLEPTQHLVNWIGGHLPSIKKAREKSDASIGM